MYVRSRSKECLSVNVVACTVSQEDPHKTVQAFVDLVRRHEQMFYSFVYKVHSRGGSLFDNLMKFIELFLTIVRDGIGDQTSLEFLLPHTGQEREAIMKEIDDVALYHYKLKLAHEDKLRKRFGRTQKQSEADAEDEATAALVQGVVNDISFGALVDGEAEDLAAEASASDDSSDSSSSDECDSDDGSDDDDDEDEYESGEGVKPPPPPPKLPPPDRLSGSPNISPTPMSRDATMTASRSETTASSVSLDLEAKERLTVAQRLRNSKSMEMLRRGKSMSVELPPPPPIPQQHHPYQVYRPKRSTTVNSTCPPRVTPQSSSGSLRRPPPTRKPPTPPKEIATTADTAEGSGINSRTISDSTITMDSQDSATTPTTATSEGSTWSSIASLESDKNKPLPDPKTRVGLDPDTTPRIPQTDPDAVPKIGQKKPKLKRVASRIEPPELTHTPKLLPVFVELVSCDISFDFECFAYAFFWGDCSFQETSLRSSNEVVDWLSVGLITTCVCVSELAHPIEPPFPFLPCD